MISSKNDRVPISQSALKACRNFRSRSALFVETISASGLACFVSVNEFNKRRRKCSTVWTH